jgi:hypothetical protein
VRPSRRALRALRMRLFLVTALTSLPHAEERSGRSASRSTHNPDAGNLGHYPTESLIDRSVGILYTRSTNSSSIGPYRVGNLGTLRFTTPVLMNKGLIQFT